MKDAKRPRLGIKPKVWSHDDHLRSLKGKTISVWLKDQNVTGVLVEYDRFTLLMRNGADIVIFKHAIISVWEVPSN